MARAIEGLLILIAALGIGYTAFERLVSPSPLTHVELGLAISVAAASVNGGVALILLRAGHRLRSITLTADAHHLLTDVGTSAGVLVGVLLVQITGWLLLDLLVALLVAANIVWTAFLLLGDTALGVLDTALLPSDQERIRAVLAPYQARGIGFHALRTRAAGQRQFVSIHVLVPGTWSIHRGHTLAEEIEQQSGRYAQRQRSLHIWSLLRTPILGMTRPWSASPICKMSMSRSLPCPSPPTMRSIKPVCIITARMGMSPAARHESNQLFVPVVRRRGSHRCVSRHQTGRRGVQRNSDSNAPCRGDR